MMHLKQPVLPRSSPRLPSRTQNRAHAQPVQAGVGQDLVKDHAVKDHAVKDHAVKDHAGALVALPDPLVGVGRGFGRARAKAGRVRGRESRN